MRKYSHENTNRRKTTRCSCVVVSSWLEAECRPEVRACAGADAVRDDEVEMDERRGEPDAAAESAREVLIREVLALVVDVPDVDEDADAGFADVQRRRERRQNFRGAGDQRIANCRSRFETAKAVHPTEHRLQVRRKRDVGIVTLRAQNEDVLPEESDVAAAVEFGA